MVPTDAEVLAGLRRGDGKAADTLVERHREWAVATACKLGAGADAEDLAHDAMMSVIQRPPADLQRESLRPLLQTAIWQRIENARRRRGRQVRPLPSSAFVDPRQSPSSLIGARQERARLLEFVQVLRTRDRQLFQLRYVEELPAPQISQVMDMSPGAVRVALHRLGKTLRQLSRVHPG